MKSNSLSNSLCTSCLNVYSDIFKYTILSHIGVSAILSVEIDVTENSATLIHELPCFSPGLQCVMSNFTTNDMDFNNMNSVTSDVTDSMMAYSYPTQTITLSGLNSGTTYNYCVGVTNTTNMTNMMEIGESMCGNFTTQKKGKSICMYIRNYLLKLHYSLSPSLVTCVYHNVTRHP